LKEEFDQFEYIGEGTMKGIPRIQKKGWHREDVWLDYMMDQHSSSEASECKSFTL
jgi:hypothetical protein